MPVSSVNIQHGSGEHVISNLLAHRGVYSGRRTTLSRSLSLPLSLSFSTHSVCCTNAHTHTHKHTLGKLKTLTFSIVMAPVTEIIAHNDLILTSLVSLMPNNLIIPCTTSHYFNATLSPQCMGLYLAPLLFSTLFKLYSSDSGDWPQKNTKQRLNCPPAHFTLEDLFLCKTNTHRVWSNELPAMNAQWI